MRGTILEVAILADISESHSVISSVYQCVTGPLWYELSLLPYDSLDWLVNKALMEWPLNLDDLLWITSYDVNLSIITIFCSFFNRRYIYWIYV